MTEPIRASLDHCVKCTICETFCPYSRVTPLFPGASRPGSRFTVTLPASLERAGVG